MEILQESKDIYKKSFFSHVFSTTEEGKAELLNVVQYSLFGVVPVVVLNKIIQRFVPEADIDKSSLEILVEILIQLIVMFCGIVFIHRIITYFPTYSGYKYDNLVLTNVILAFLVLILSIQTKLGLKVNILVERIYELWNGPSSDDDEKPKKRLRVRQNSGTGNGHVSSQADYLDDSPVQTMFPPAPSATGGYDHMIRGGAASDDYPAPIAANSVLGGSFGSMF